MKIPRYNSFLNHLVSTVESLKYIGANESGKTREHLEPKWQIGAAVTRLKDFQKALVSLVHSKKPKNDTDVAKFAMKERKEISLSLEKHA